MSLTTLETNHYVLVTVWGLFISYFTKNNMRKILREFKSGYYNITKTTVNKIEN